MRIMGNWEKWSETKERKGLQNEGSRRENEWMDLKKKKKKEQMGRYWMWSDNLLLVISDLIGSPVV